MTALLGVPDDRLSGPFMEVLGDAASITHVVLPNFGPKRLKALVEIIAQRPEGGEMAAAVTSSPPAPRLMPPRGHPLKSPADPTPSA